MGFKRKLTKTKVFCLDCSVSILLFSDIWKFIYLTELSIQKNTHKKNPTSSQVDERYWFVLFVPATWGEGRCATEKR